MQGTIALQNFLIPCLPLDKLEINQLICEQVLRSISGTGTSVGAPGRAQAAVGKRVASLQGDCLENRWQKCNSIQNPGRRGILCVIDKEICKD